MAARRKKVKIGDIIAIPIDNQRHCYSQIIVNTYGLQSYHIVFDLISKEHPPIDSIVKTEIIIAAFITDNSIHSGKWAIIGNSLILQKVIIPEFTVELMENRVCTKVVQSYDGTILRVATKEDIAKLKGKHSYTPGVLERVLRAKFGLEPWNPYYDNLIYKTPEFH